MIELTPKRSNYSTSPLMENRYVEVIFPLPLNQTFTYQWAIDETSSPVGYRVLVPFQSRLVTGYVIGESNETSLATVKDVKDVLDEAPVLTSELIGLIRYISEKYGTSLGEALLTVIPGGLIKQTKKTIFVEEKNDVLLPDEERKILQTLRDKKSTDWNLWAKKNPQTLHLIRKLQKEGWIRVESILQKQKASNSKASISRMIKKISGSDVLLDSFLLTPDQKSVVDRINSGVSKKELASILLHGVTGSGKTEVYLQAAEHCLKAGRSVLALVPEISLTPQFLTRFKSRFGKKIALFHSQRSETEKLFEWKRVLAGEAKIVVGTRSSVFSPLKNIGLIILDEEHDRSYKQEDRVMYHVKDIVMKRALEEKSVVLLGSATPSIETFYQAETGKIEKAILPSRIHQLEMPEVEIVDLQKEKRFGEKTMFSEKLKEELTKVLERGKQAILFLNRRGYSTCIYCPQCGLTLQCPNCSISMTYHQNTDTFQCHYCDLIASTDQACTSCKSTKWIRFGFGTERVEKEVGYLFPDARIARLDRDTAKKKNAFDHVFTNFEQKKIDILIGTQMITKGLDFEHVDLVGVLLADQGLHYPDFRASEMTFQLLTQVIGRTGRGKERGKAILQTLQPEHYSILSATSQNYKEFYDCEIKYRKQAMYPPFSKILLYEIKGKNREMVEQMSLWLKKQIEVKNKQDSNFVILGPSPAPIEKINSNFRFHLFLKSINRPDVEKNAMWVYEKSRDLFKERGLILKFNLEPYDFM